MTITTVSCAPASHAISRQLPQDLHPDHAHVCSNNTLTKHLSAAMASLIKLLSAVMALGYALVPLQHWAVTSVVSLSAMAADLLVNQALLTRRPRTNQLSQPSRQAARGPELGLFADTGGMQGPAITFIQHTWSKITDAELMHASTAVNDEVAHRSACCTTAGHHEGCCCAPEQSFKRAWWLPAYQKTASPPAHNRPGHCSACMTTSVVYLYLTCLCLSKMKHVSAAGWPWCAWQLARSAMQQCLMFPRPSLSSAGSCCWWLLPPCSLGS